MHVKYLKPDINIEIFWLIKDKTLLLKLLHISGFMNESCDQYWKIIIYVSEISLHEIYMVTAFQNDIIVCFEMATLNYIIIRSLISLSFNS